MGFVTLKDFFPDQLVSLTGGDKQLSKSSKLPSKISPGNLNEYAFIKLKKLPLRTPRNVLSAMVHFYNVKGAAEEDRKVAFKKILNKAAQFEICTMEFLKKYEQYVDDAQNS